MQRIDTKNLSYEEWLQYRSKYIGGSDAGAIAGLNPFKTSFQVFLEKTNQTELKQIDNERMRIGRDLEDYVAHRFSEATGKKVRRNNFMMIDGFMSANVDREVVGENAVLECKTTNSYAKSDWEDDKIPIHYELQCHHYMMVGGYDKAYIAVLIGNEKFIYKEIPRDEETIEMLRKIETDFWKENVENKIIPEADGTNAYSTELKNRYKGGIEEYTDIDINLEKINRLEELKNIKKETDKKIKKIEQEIQSKMKDFEYGRKDNFSFSWKTQKRESIDTRRIKKEKPEIFEEFKKESTYRVFRIKEIKE